MARKCKSGDESQATAKVDQQVSLVPKQFRKRKRICAPPKGGWKKCRNSRTQLPQIEPKVDMARKCKSSLIGDDGQVTAEVEQHVSLVPKQLRKRKRICAPPKGGWKKCRNSRTQLPQIEPKVDMARKCKSSLIGDDGQVTAEVEQHVSLVPKQLRKRKRICAPPKGGWKKCRNSRTQLPQIEPKVDDYNISERCPLSDAAFSSPAHDVELSEAPQQQPEHLSEPECLIEVEQPPETEQPIAVEQQPSESEQPIGVEQPSEPEQLIEVEQLIVVEQPSEPEHLIGVEQPPEPEQLVEVEQLIVVEQPSESEQPPETEQLVEVEQPSEPEQLVEVEQLIVVEQPSESEQPPETEQLVEVEQPSEPEQLVEVEQASVHGASNWRRKAASLHPNFMLAPSGEETTVFVSLYLTRHPTVKWSVTIDAMNRASVDVHGKGIPSDNKFWFQVPSIMKSEVDVVKFLSELQTNNVCMGSPDEEFVDLVPINAGITLAGQRGIQAYREGNFNAVLGNLKYNSTIRHTNCQLLVQGTRCLPCRKLRDVLRHRLNRKNSKSAEVSAEVSSKKGNVFMTEAEKCEKMKKMAQSNKYLKRRVSILEERNSKLKEKSKLLIDRGGENLNSGDSDCMVELMKECEKEVGNSFAENSFQRIFFEQQLKYNKCKNKSGMRWHPAVIRMCLYLKSKSAKAYDGLRACLALPSQRTLYDYTNYMESGTGFKTKVTEQLIAESTRQGLYTASHKSYVGILQDEVRIKSDLVYDKHSGELVGYIDLDRVGNELLNLEEALIDEDRKVAKYMLVVMVRGVTSNLKYPLAAFATEGITADFLYPILWEAIETVQADAGLEVLFVCCDGASPNRRFFTLHSATRDHYVYRTENPFCTILQYLYFISDVPHLIKTTRNCVSNSHAHRRSRPLWNNGSISWQHIVDLYNNYCVGAYRLCPKLSDNHINLTSFALMKVNLATQVMSRTVGLALQLVNPIEASQTAEFILLMNKWFDIMNSRNINEGRNARNENLAPFTDVNDPRLNWMLNDFLGFFANWEQAVEQHYGHLSKKEKAAMQLSHQTIKGLTITTKSIAECVRFLLDQGADFVLTNHFNQDPLELHFGHLRQKGGANENPTVYEVCHTLNQVRTVHAQALAPRRGNVQGNVLEQFDVNIPIPRRGR